MSINPSTMRETISIDVTAREATEASILMLSSLRVVVPPSVILEQLTIAGKSLCHAGLEQTPWVITKEQAWITHTAISACLQNPTIHEEEKERPGLLDGARSLNIRLSIGLGAIPALPWGDTEVWYMRPDWFREGITGSVPDPHRLEKTHILLGNVTCENREALWKELQGENWSPNGEATSFIESKGLGHTSMSVGDVCVIDGEVHLCGNVGFKVIGRKDAECSYN